jgi:hypothetical protein
METSKHKYFAAEEEEKNLEAVDDDNISMRQGFDDAAEPHEKISNARL